METGRSAEERGCGDLRPESGLLVSALPLRFLAVVALLVEHFVERPGQGIGMFVAVIGTVIIRRG
jgi:hypothetical protein